MCNYLLNKDINTYLFMDYTKLHKTIETSKISFTELCKKIHLTRKTLYNNIENKTLKVETLEKICKELKLPITTFFDHPHPAMVNEPLGKYGKTQSDCNEVREQLEFYKNLYSKTQKTVAALTTAVEMLSNKKVKG